MAAPGDPYAKLIAYARAMTPVLDQKSYYQLLQIDPSSDLPAIRAAYYRAAATLHPDRYHGLPDPAVRAELAAIYARISEGYRVLTSPPKRAAYDRSLAQGQVRWLSNEREKKGPQNPEETIGHPEAKKFFRLGLQALARRDWKGAVMNFKFARNFDPASGVVAEKLAEAEAGLKAATSKPAP